jgi:hypothetical protein
MRFSQCPGVINVAIGSGRTGEHADVRPALTPRLFFNYAAGQHATVKAPLNCSVIQFALWCSTQVYRRMGRVL